MNLRLDVDKPFKLGNCCNSTSLVNRYLDDPCDFFCLRLKEPFLYGSILSTNPADGACRVLGEEVVVDPGGWSVDELDGAEPQVLYHQHSTWRDDHLGGLVKQVNTNSC